MKRLFVGVAILTAVMVLAITAVCLVAGSALNTGDCSQPCVTPLQQVEAQLNRDQAAFIFSNNDATIPLSQWTVTVMDPVLPHSWDAGVLTGVFSEPFLAFNGLKAPPRKYYVSDAILLFGRPVAAMLCWRADDPFLARPYIGAHVFFKNNVELLAYDLSRRYEMRFSPTMTVWLIGYRSSSTGPLYPFDAPRWYGFTGPHNDPQVC